MSRHCSRLRNSCRISLCFAGDKGGGARIAAVIVVEFALVASVSVDIAFKPPSPPEEEALFNNSKKASETVPLAAILASVDRSTTIGPGTERSHLSQTIASSCLSLEFLLVPPPFSVDVGRNKDSLSNPLRKRKALPSSTQLVALLAWAPASFPSASRRRSDWRRVVAARLARSRKGLSSSAWWSILLFSSFLVLMIVSSSPMEGGGGAAVVSARNRRVEVVVLRLVLLAASSFALVLQVTIPGPPIMEVVDSHNCAVCDEVSGRMMLPNPKHCAEGMMVIPMRSSGRTGSSGGVRVAEKIVMVIKY
mmetsp:Transcript_12546/g.25699  ORF Transcript_12546/g.25699 Transcript_12546/m.25699 type:complete len:307 (+) Transcript_12546:323-1243(+)